MREKLARYLKTQAVSYLMTISFLLGRPVKYFFKELFGNYFYP